MLNFRVLIMASGSKADLARARTMEVTSTVCTDFLLTDWKKPTLSSLMWFAMATHVRT